MQYIAHIDQDRIQSVKEHLEGRQRFLESLRGNLGNKTGATVMGYYMILESILWIF